MNGDISALGSRELVLLFSIFFYFYTRIVRNKIYANKLLFTIGFGIVIILIVKFTTSKLEDFSINSILIESLSNFPSGHTFIATVMFLSIAKSLSLRERGNQVNRYLFFSASILIIMVGISRLLGAGHTITEVIAGWSLGLAWYTFAQMFLEIDHKSIINK